MKLITSLLPMAATVHATRSHSAPLAFDVYHAPQFPAQYANTTLPFSPQAFTLIHSAHEAILVDAPVYAASAEMIASWIASTVPGKKLVGIYITHGHVDHFNTFSTIQKTFPEAKVLATDKVKVHMQGQLEEWDSFWAPHFPGIVKPNLSSVVTLPADGKFYLEDRYELRAVQVGEGDTADSSVLHVPSLDLVVAGDVVYGHCYQYLAENPTQELRDQWISSIEKVRALQPATIVPSHMQEGEGYEVQHLDETEDYLRNWGTWVGEVKSSGELQALAKRKYPERIGELILRLSADTAFNITG